MTSNIFAGIMALDGTILEADQSCLEASGYRLEQVIGLPFWETPWWRGSKEVQRKLSVGTVQAKEGTQYHELLPYLWADGSEHVVEFALYPIRDESGKVIFLYPIGIDVTEGKRAEEVLRQSEQRFRALATATSDVLYSMSPDWSEVRQLYGRYSIAEVNKSGHAWLEKYIHAEDRMRVLQAIHHAVRTKSSFELEYRIQRTDGTVGWILSRAIPLLDAAGEILEWAGAATDITARKQAEEALRKADKLAGAGLMAAAIAHEIHNPLEAVTNLWYLLSQEAMSPAGVQYVQTLGAELDRLARVTKQTLQFYQEVPDAAATDLAELIEGSVRFFAPTAKKKGAMIIAEYKGAATVRASEGELRQVFANLIMNALQAGATVIKIRISACKDWRDASHIGAYSGVRVTFADNGIGIPVHIEKKLFAPFFTTKDENGTGLGLWVSKGIIQKYGGAIRMRSSTQPGRSGTSFCIFLPAATPDISSMNSPKAA